MGNRSSYVNHLGVILAAAALVAGGASADSLKVVSDFDPDDSVELRGGSLTSPDIIWTNDETFGTLRFNSAFLTGIGSVPQWRFDGANRIELSALVTGSEILLFAERGGLLLASENPSQRYLVDSDEDDAVANHIWYENSTSNTGPDWRMMQLTEEMGGTLKVDGPVIQNHSFDIAETFWEAEPVEPGELVAIDPENPATVRPTSRPSQATLLGVASTRPGFVLGGGAFSVEAFRGTWGDEIADAYERQLPELEERVFAEIPQLRERAERLRSQASYEAHLALEPVEPEARRPGTDEIRAAYETACANHEELMLDRTLGQFFEERFAAVALAGRVPVKADASFGAIRPGDPLTSSPIAGVAMRASGPGPIIGTALDSLSQGTGLVQVFVHRGWYGGEGLSPGVPRTARAAPDPRDREIADLKSRLAVLERRLDGLLPGEAALASSGASPATGPPSP